MASFNSNRREKYCDMVSTRANLGHVMVNSLQGPSYMPRKGGGVRPPASPADQQLPLQQMTIPVTLFPTAAIRIYIKI